MKHLEDILDGEKMVGGIMMRPFTIGSQSACKQMGLTVFTSGDTQVSEDEATRQIMAFAWMHCAPIRKVLEAIRKGTAEEEAQLFSFSVMPNAMTDIVQEINRISTQARENSVDVIARNESVSEDTPGN
jgi:hypothetical protein